jgi:hypothetical protein
MEETATAVSHVIGRYFWTVLTTVLAAAVIGLGSWILDGKAALQENKLAVAEAMREIQAMQTQADSFRTMQGTIINQINLLQAADTRRADAYLDMRRADNDQNMMLDRISTQINQLMISQTRLSTIMHMSQDADEQQRDAGPPPRVNRGEH